MCFNKEISGGFSLLGLFAVFWIVRYTKNYALAIGVGYYCLMEILQFFQYFFIAPNLHSPICDEIMNQVLTFVGFAHIAYQPYFCHVINAALTASPKYKEQYKVVKRLCLLGGTALLSRYFLAPYGSTMDMTTLEDGMQSPSTEWLRGEKLCTFRGRLHLAWSVPMADPSYYVPSAFIHFFLMFAPFLCMWEKRGMVVQGLFLFTSGPFLASILTPYLMEQASVWCFFSIMQILTMLFLIRETLIVRWGRDDAKRSLIKKREAANAKRNGAKSD
eukprot:CAMPEP_0196769850 /NCGR_PEP_ID=MMETSP1104-20130614/789_1 /TAXON_ID=33652 /ORGANISM="Cafeteria sp., Strain Caron Lab Isolate" /LENGTH=273 /DNA_ID=CAMNT_0042139953 /DNA_START=1 /DNA_END=822 /DNA_ORIENTATION=+